MHYCLRLVTGLPSLSFIEKQSNLPSTFASKFSLAASWSIMLLLMNTHLQVAPFYIGLQFLQLLISSSTTPQMILIWICLLSNCWAHAHWSGLFTDIIIIQGLSFHFPTMLPGVSGIHTNMNTSLTLPLLSPMPPKMKTKPHLLLSTTITISVLLVPHILTIQLSQQKSWLSPQL